MAEWVLLPVRIVVSDLAAHRCDSFARFSCGIFGDNRANGSQLVFGGAGAI